MSRSVGRPVNHDTVVQVVKRVGVGGDAMTDKTILQPIVQVEAGWGVGDTAHAQGVMVAPPARLDGLLDAFLARRSAATRLAYGADLKDLARHLGVDTPHAAVWELISHGPGQANGLVLNYKGSMVEAKLTPATVNRRLAALRSVVALARTLGIVGWTLTVGGEKSRAYRNTRGPGRHGVQMMLSQIQGNSPKDVRGRAILRLLYDLGLRREEVSALRREDVDLDSERVWVMGKGSGERDAITLPPKTVETLRAWLAVRGDEAGPLFHNFDRARKRAGLTGSGVYHVIRALGVRVGLKVHPHGIRHAAVTEALDRTGNPRSVQRFSRHADIATVMKYDDNRTDLGGEVARIVSEGL